jgi:hypothetical protein
MPHNIGASCDPPKAQAPLAVDGTGIAASGVAIIIRKGNSVVGALI